MITAGPLLLEIANYARPLSKNHASSAFSGDLKPTP
jgi:hypothetical protein